MRIKLTEVQTSRSGSTTVTFSSPVGTGRVAWKSRSLLPAVEKSYDVELTIEQPCCVGKNLQVTKIDGPPIAMVGAMVVFRGLIDGIDSDSVAYLRLSADCLVMIEVVGSLCVDDEVRIEVIGESVSVTPIGS